MASNTKSVSKSSSNKYRNPPLKISASARYSEVDHTLLYRVVTEDDLKNNSVVFEYFASEITRFYADIDIKSLEMKEEQFDALRAHANEAFSGLGEGFVYTDGSYFSDEKVKLSFHIINKNIRIHKPSFTFKCEYGILMKNEILKNFKTTMSVGGIELNPRELFESNLDDDVYGGKVCFRLPYAVCFDKYKPDNNKPNPHIPMVHTNDVSDYFVSPDPDTSLYHPLMDKRILEFRSERDRKASMVQSLEMKKCLAPKKSEEEENLILEETQTQLIEKLNLIKLERFQEHDAWRVLLALIKGNGLPRDMFLDFSKRSGYKNYSEEACLTEWFKLKDIDEIPRFKTVNTWLDEDGVDWKSLFCKKKRGMIGDLLKAWQSYGSLTDMSIAEIFFNHYKESLYFTQSGWIHYNDLRGWEIGDDSVVIYPLMKLIGEAMNNYVIKMKPEKDEDPAKFDMKRKHLLKETVALCSHNKCTKVIKTAQNLFKNDKIIEEFDAHDDWFCFSDFKAIHMPTGDIIEIKKEDKIITTCGYPLPERDAVQIERAKSFIETLVEPSSSKNSISPYDSFMSMLSCSFYGDPNKNQKIFIHTGSGGNGKSLVGLLMNNTLKNYAGVLPIEQLTKDSKGRDDANSSLAMMRGKRYAQFNEPEDCKDTNLKIARVKELSGEDKIKVREIYKQAFDMRVTFTMNLFCNEKPKMSKSDGGIERRLAVFPYVYSFVDEPDIEDAYQRQKDDMLGQVMKTDVEFRHGFLYLCLDHWRQNQGRFVCADNVKEANKEYLMENNPVASWLTEKYTVSTTEFIRSKILLEEYIKTTGQHLTSTSFNRFIVQLGIKIVEDKSNGKKIYLQLK